MVWTSRGIVSLILLILAIICFCFVAFDWTPNGWTVNLAWLGMALFAGSFLPGVWVTRAP